MTNKVDIFELLKRVDARDIEFYESLSQPEKNSVAPVVALRWFSSGSDQHVHLSNFVINPVVFPLYKHPGLLYKMMVACSDGKKKRYSWVKKKSKDKSAPNADKTIAEYYQCSVKDASSYRRKLASEDILEMAEDMGYDAERIKKIKAELK